MNRTLNTKQRNLNTKGKKKKLNYEKNAIVNSAKSMIQDKQISNEKTQTAEQLTNIVKVEIGSKVKKVQDVTLGTTKDVAKYTAKKTASYAYDKIAENIKTRKRRKLSLRANSMNSVSNTTSNNTQRPRRRFLSHKTKNLNTNKKSLNILNKITKFRKNTKSTQNASNARPLIHKRVYKAIKHPVKSIVHLVSKLIRMLIYKLTGVALSSLIPLFLVFLLLVIIIFMFLTFVGVENYKEDEILKGYAYSISEELKPYQETVSLYCDVYKISKFETLVYAIMEEELTQRESNKDTEFKNYYYNEKDLMGIERLGIEIPYESFSDDYTLEEYSIQIGIQRLSEAINSTFREDKYDESNISHALAIYAYGEEYFTWFNQDYHGMNYDEKLKDKYLTDVLKKYTDNKDPMKHFVQNVLNKHITISVDLVKIAESQLGNKGGQPYWSWFGFDSHVQWCACFASWCLNEAGLIDKGLAPKFSYCNDGIKWFREHDSWLIPQKEPLVGSLIFFNWNGDDICDHVGIVEKVDGEKVYTIEGNTGCTAYPLGQCLRQEYSRNYEGIIGYGVPLNPSQKPKEE